MKNNFDKAARQTSLRGLLLLESASSEGGAFEAASNNAAAGPLDSKN